MIRGGRRESERIRRILREDMREHLTYVYVARGIKGSVGLHRDAQDYNDIGLDYGRNYGSNVPTVYFVAFIHEFGLAVNGKYRGWYTKAILHNRDKVETRIEQAFRTAGNSSRVFFREIEKVLELWVRETVYSVDRREIDLPDNTEFTQWLKRGTIPMIDTGHMMRQLDYKLERNR